MRPPSESSDELLVRQPYRLRAVGLLNALLCFIVGGQGGLAGSSAARTVWFTVGLVWVALYLWAAVVPYIRVSADRVVVRSRPFSGGEASIKSISEMSFADNVVGIQQVGGVPLRIDLSRVPQDQRSDVLSVLRKVKEQVVELERLEAREFEATWGVNPATQRLRDT